MSRTLSNVSSVMYDREVKHAYQTLEATLSGTTSERNGIEGKSIQFRRIGKGMATERTAPSADAEVMNVDHTMVECLLQDWEANEYTDIFDKEKVNFDEVKELAKVIAGAIGRRSDQIKLAAMVAGTYSATPAAGEGGLVEVAIGGADTNLNVDKLRAISKFMNKKGVPAEGRHIAVSAEGLEGLLGETEVTSADFASIKALVQGDVDTFMGFKFHMISDREEGGLPIATGVRDGFAWHESAIGYATGDVMKTSVEYSVDKKSWLSAGNLSAGAVIRDNEGIVKYQAKES